MGFTERTLFQPKTPDHREVRYCGTITVGAAGAITAQTSNELSGSIATKQAAAGRYKIQLHKPYRSRKGVSASFIRASATAPANTVGESGNPGWHTDNLSVDGSIMLQCSRGSDTADADVTSGVVICWEIVVSEAK